MHVPSLWTGRSPLLTTTLQAILINICANVIAQLLESHKRARADHTPADATAVSEFHLDVRRVMHFVIWTCITVPPNFRFQQWLERRFPAYVVEERRKSIADDDGAVSLTGSISIT